MPASHNVHPEFGFLCPTPRFRRRLRLVLAGLVVAGIGAGVMAATGGSKPDAAANRVDAASFVATAPVASTPLSFTTVRPRTAVVAGAPATADKPACVGDTRSDGNCLAVKLRKPRMVRVATDRPAIAAVAIGRSTAPATGMVDVALSGAGPASAMAKASEAEVAAASTTGSEKSAAGQEAEKSASRQNRRRDPYWYGAPSGARSSIKGADTVAGATGQFLVRPAAGTPSVNPGRIEMRRCRLQADIRPGRAVGAGWLESAV